MIELFDLIQKAFTLFIIFFLLIFYFIIEIIFFIKLKSIEKHFYKKYELDSKLYSIKIKVSEIETIKEEDQVYYYKTKNILSFIRYTSLFIFIIAFILYKIPDFFNSFAIAIWAIIIAFKEMILSFFAYFYIITFYKTWDNLIINDWNVREIKWEIIYVNLLNIWLVWKNDNSENNWKIYRIPNYKFFTENIKKEENSINKYNLIEIKILFSKDIFILSLEDFLDRLTYHLNNLLPKKTIWQVWNFKSFVWYRYKIRFFYEEEYFFIQISFIEKPKNIFEIEKSIFSYIESFKK